VILRLVILLLAIAPALALLCYGIKKARSTWKNEALWAAFFTGCLAALGIVAAEIGIHALLKGVFSSPITNAASEALFVAAIPEETAKFLVLICIALKHADVRREQDTIVLALGVSLGFAALENLFYLAGEHDWASLALLRALTAVPGHGVNGLAMGAMVTLARLSKSWSACAYAAALAFPVTLHAVYDFFPMLAVQYKDVSHTDLFWGWAMIMGLSAIFVIAFCNQVFAEAAAADALRSERRSSPATASSARSAEHLRVQ
jgi:RsiW-degrading membrane proteinase PrsW (M82 family)